MTDRPTPPQPELTEEEIRAQLEAAQARLAEQMEKAQHELTEAQRLLEADRDKVAAELAETEERVRKLTPYRTHPEGGFHYMSASAYAKAKAAELKMLEIQLSALAHNQGLAQSGPPEGWDGEGSPFRDPATEPAYNVARVSMDYYLAGFFWLQRLEPIDTILRAVGYEPAIRPHHDEEEALRAARAADLKSRFSADKEAQIAVMRLAEELNLAQAVLPWAKTALGRLEVLAPAEQRVLLSDPDWNKLNGAFRALEGLPGAIAANPVLDAFDFGTPDIEVQVDDPFDDIKLPGF